MPPSIKFFLVGTRLDEPKNREVKKDKGETTAQRLHAKYHEVSAKTGDGVRETLESLVEEMGF